MNQCDPTYNFVPLRYIESGRYRGFYPVAEALLKRKLGEQQKKVIPWRVYTDMDIILAKPPKQSSEFL